MDDSPSPADIPMPVPRPTLAGWLHARGITYAAAGDRLGRSREYVRLLCLPFDDKRRRQPDPKALLLIIEMTGGEITAEDFYPPHLTRLGRLALESEAAS